MPIKLPNEIVYFYEITRIADRLLYCIPKKQLQSMVDKGKVQNTIMEDYPDGVDIKVSPVQFQEYQNQYGMTFEMNPRLIWQTFKFLKSKTKKNYFGTGFIKKKFLENLSEQIKSDYDEFTKLIPSVDREKASFKLQKRIQRKLQSKQRRLEKQLKKKSFDTINPKKPINEQIFSRIKMSKGVEAFDFLSNIKQKSKEGNKHGR